MKKIADVIVVGKGLAGLFASINIAKNNKSVTLISEGIGSLAIGSGSIDLLGYIGSQLIKDNPLDHIKELDHNHPYRLIGRENILEAMNCFKEITAEVGLHFTNKNNQNKSLVTVIGRRKPSFLSTDSSDASILDKTDNILLIGIDGIKDYDVRLIKQQLDFDYNNKKKIDTIQISNPFSNTYRNISSLDLARYIETTDGYNWLIDNILSASVHYTAILIPPILGVENHSQIYGQIKNQIKAKVIEMSTIPPGVAGLRIYYALLKVISKLPITIIDNAKVVSSNIKDKKCISLSTSFTVNKKEIRNEYFAKDFIIATGGFLGGGLIGTEDKIIEPIFKLNIKDAPSVIDRSMKDVFADHFFAKAGVDVNNKLKAIDMHGNELIDNVYFAGKMLANYNFPQEKSGYGVALSSAYHISKLIG